MISFLLWKKGGNAAKRRLEVAIQIPSVKDYWYWPTIGKNGIVYS